MAHLKCNECSEYFQVDYFWPPKTQDQVVCPECGTTAEWVWEQTAQDSKPNLYLKWITLAGSETLEGNSNA
jgi:DNA-directed RNA polymerase subunit RPC12/RpoP